MRRWFCAILIAGTGLAGCGTTRWSDTQRTATEQLLISDAIDRAVSQLDFSLLAERKVYLDTGPLRNTVDAAYLISTLRQHALSAGCAIKDKAEEADYVVEVRAGAVGTDRRELLFGIPAAKLPAAVPVAGVPASIPEVPLATKTEQRAVAKIAVFAYNRQTGKPVWQSGVIPVESKARDLWVLGAGPFQRGSIYSGTRLAGRRIRLPLPGPGKRNDGPLPLPSVAKEAHYLDSEIELAEGEQQPNAIQTSPEQSGASADGVRPAAHSAAAADIPLPPVPPGPSGTSSHRGLGTSVDLSGFGQKRPEAATKPSEGENKPASPLQATPAAPSPKP